MDSFEDLMNFLIARKAPDLPLEAIGKVFDRLIWCSDDNGCEILAIREKWLECEDVQKIEIALSMNETLPFSDWQRMISVFARICVTWPQFKSRCDELLEIRAKWESGGG